LIDKVDIKNFSKKKLFLLIKKYKNFPIYQAPHALFNILVLHIPIYFYSFYFDSYIVGLYSLGTKIVLMPMAIFSATNAKVYAQKVSQDYYDKKNLYDFSLKYLKSIFLKTFFIFFIFIYFSPEIFKIVFGVKWVEAGVYIQILSPWLFLNMIVSTISYIPSLVGKQKKALKVSFIHILLITLGLYIGIIENNIYISLAFFTLFNFLILLYNLKWMLDSLKKV
jgi:O-antigen/teichoic acid export membrane protein